MGKKLGCGSVILGTWIVGIVAVIAIVCLSWYGSIKQTQEDLTWLRLHVMLNTDVLNDWNAKLQDLERSSREISQRWFNRAQREHHATLHEDLQSLRRELDSFTNEHERLQNRLSHIVALYAEGHDMHSRVRLLRNDYNRWVEDTKKYTPRYNEFVERWNSFYQQ